eukprot:1158919-Pelagomonas_calceolata.AAC.13
MQQAGCARQLGAHMCALSATGRAAAHKRREPSRQKVKAAEDHFPRLDFERLSTEQKLKTPYHWHPNPFNIQQHSDKASNNASMSNRDWTLGAAPVPAACAQSGWKHCMYGTP